MTELSKAEQLLAFCDWERKHNPQAEGKPHIAEWSYAEIERLSNERRVLAHWMVEAIDALCDFDADAEDGGEALRALKEQGQQLVQAVLLNGLLMGNQQHDQD